MESFTLESNRRDVVRQIKVPKINVEGTHFHELTNVDNINDISQPPVVMDWNGTLIAEMLTKTLVLQHRVTTKMWKDAFTEAAFVVSRCEKDDAIRQKIKSRLLMNNFDSKQQFI